jgi:hypothetical protein
MHSTTQSNSPTLLRVWSGPQNDSGRSRWPSHVVSSIYRTQHRNVETTLLKTVIVKDRNAEH